MVRDQPFDHLLQALAIELTPLALWRDETSLGILD